MFLYRDILKQSWQIIWRNKFLWFFGIFAALLGNVGEYKILSYSLGKEEQNFLSFFNEISQTGIFSQQALNNIAEIIKQDPLSFVVMLVVFLAILILFCFLIWLAVISQIVIVDNSVDITKQEKYSFFKKALQGSKNFWKVFALNIVANIVIILILSIIGLPFFSVFNKIGIAVVSLLYVILFLFLIPIAISLSLIAKYAIAYIVIKENKLIEAIKNGWKLFVNNWIVSFEMALILFFINFIVSLLIILITLILIVPFLFLIFIFYYFAMVFGFWIVVFLAFLSILLLIIIGGAMLATFQISAWTRLFLELIENGGTSKIVRILSNVIKK